MTNDGRGHWAIAVLGTGTSWKEEPGMRPTAISGREALEPAGTSIRDATGRRPCSAYLCAPQPSTAKRWSPYRWS